MRDVQIDARYWLTTRQRGQDGPPRWAMMQKSGAESVGDNVQGWFLMRWAPKYKRAFERTLCNGANDELLSYSGTKWETQFKRGLGRYLSPSTTPALVRLRAPSE